VIVSGDSDFSPLVSKLKELGKHVIGLGMQKSTSDLLRDNCDEFIYYEDLGQIAAESPAIDSHLPEMKRKAFGLLLETLLALRRGAGAGGQGRAGGAARRRRGRGADEPAGGGPAAAGRGAARAASFAAAAAGDGGGVRVAGPGRGACRGRGGRGRRAQAGEG